MCSRVSQKLLTFDAISGDQILTVNGPYEANEKKIMSKDF